MKKLLSSLIVIPIFLFVTCSAFASSISLDTTYGTSGKVITTFNSDAYALSMTLQSDGKALVMGYISNGNNLDWAIKRYNTDGSLDASFGNNGQVLRNFGGNDILEKIIMQGGKIIVAGYSQPTGNSTWTLARLNSDGTFDSSFGNNGIVVTPVLGNNPANLASFELQSDGKILAVGYVNNGNDDVALARYDTNGALDNSFGNAGLVIHSIGGSNDRGNSIAMQPNGKIVVFGDFNAGGHDDVFLAQFNPDGSLDNTFGNSGITTTSFESNNGGRAMTLQSDGKILVTGGTVNSANDTYVARYNSNGTLDSSFANNGKFIQSFSSGDDAANSLILQPDGKIILGGYNFNGSNLDFALRRLNSNGTLDATFGNNGSLVVPIGQNSDYINSIALQADGKIVAAGTSSNGNYNDWALARFSENSSPTPTNTPSPTPTATPITSLNVPLLKQTANPWQSQVYDSANLWSAASATINRWGCALTSAAMVFQYHGFNKLPDNIALDPGTLNTWLKSQPDGYVREGWVNWLALSRLSKLAKDINGVSFDALEYKRASGANKTQLAADINNSLPDILEEPGHFIVGKGIDGDTFSISDPYYNRQTLNDGYSNTFLSLGRYVPSHTDLSYIMIVADADVDLKLLDNNSNELGESFVQQPITDPTDPQLHNAAVRILYAPQPTDGDYGIIVSGNEDKTTEISTYLYDVQGDVSFVDNQIAGNTSFTISFDKNNSDNSTVKKIVTFQSTIEDIKELRQLDLLHFSLAISTTALIQNAEKLHDLGKDKPAGQLIDVAQKLIEDSPKRFVDPVAKDILLYDFTELKALLN